MSSQPYAVFFIPGLGQLVQGRLLMAIIQFCVAGIQEMAGVTGGAPTCSPANFSSSVCSGESL